MLKEVQVDDADVEAFIAQFAPRLNPSWSAEQRANAIYHLAREYVRVVDPEPSDEWVEALARKAHARVLWMK